MKISVIGSGSWGTALAAHLVSLGHELLLWGRNAEHLREITSARTHERYFPGQRIPVEVPTTPDLRDAAQHGELLVFALPSAVIREVARECAKAISGTDKQRTSIAVSATKGLELSTMKPMSIVLSEEVGSLHQVAVLSGPSFAAEVLRGLPTAVTVASMALPVTEKVAAAFHGKSFRVYRSADLTGVEYSGVIKNVIALAVGVIDGMQLGTNARAALITRGLAEMQRLVVALGGERETCMGLSGLGDLVLTATGELSRNRRVGVLLGEGKSLAEVRAIVGQTAESLHAAPSLVGVADRYGLAVPIIKEVDLLVAGKTTVTESAARLLSRAPTVEVERP